tara:strand:- start:326 stop:469 length:144 start_codon:yes stop_codon:yes gene_type:complete
MKPILGDFACVVDIDKTTRGTTPNNRVIKRFSICSPFWPHLPVAVGN